MIYVKNTSGDPTCVNGGMYYRAYSSHQAKICINGQWTALGVPRVTSLPANPSNGDEVYYAPNGTNGVVWHVRYDANITDSYKWMVLGGGSLFSETMASGSRNNVNWGAVTTGPVGPSISIPRGGIYEVTVGAGLWSDSNNGYAFMGYSAPGLAADDYQAVMQLGPGLNSHRRHTFISRSTITSSGTLTAQYRSNGGTAYFEGRRIFVMPIRLAQ